MANPLQNLQPRAFAGVGIIFLLLVVTAVAFYVLGWTNAFSGFVESIVYILFVAQPIGLFLRNKTQSDRMNQNLGLIILVGGLIIALVSYLVRHNTTEALTFLVLPVLAFIQSRIISV